MDSFRHKSSSDKEIDQANDDDDDTGTGRSYECVFCKRGFTTAQALGGHMNIHRKDRAKEKPYSNSTKPHHDEPEYYTNPRLFYSSIPNYQPKFSTNLEPTINYDHMYFAASTEASSRPPHGCHIDDLLVQNSSRLNPYKEDWFTSLSLHIGPTHGEDNHGKSRQGCNSIKEEEELDLELRLGHHP